jgi:hypothetical protein
VPRPLIHNAANGEGQQGDPVPEIIVYFARDSLAFFFLCIDEASCELLQPL